MVSPKHLKAAQQFLTHELITFEDELFSLLYHDIGNFGSTKTDDLISRGRRVAFYGVRGVGKTTALQGILWHSLSKAAHILPVNVVVAGAKSASSLKELEDTFYRSVIAGVIQTSYFKKREKRLKEAASKYAPWLARKITEGLSLFAPPLVLASEIAERSTKWLVGRIKKPDIQSLLSSKDYDVKQSAEVLLDHVSDEGCEPIFAVDELYKVNSDMLLSDFFDGNQSWFQGKIIAATLTYTFGESVKETAVSSIKRLATVEMYPGITNELDAERILQTRAFVGISQVDKDEGAARKSAEEIFSSDIVKAILNVSAPNAYLVLERAYEALTVAIRSKASQVLPEHVVKESAEKETPTELEQLILTELRKGRLTPADLSDQLDRKPQSIVRALGKMMKKNWVVRVGSKKRAYYSQTAGGEAALRRKEMMK